MMSFALTAIWLLLGQIAGEALATAPPGDIDSLCANKEVQLREMDDLRRLVASMKKGQHNCSPRVSKAIEDLKDIAQDEDACTMEKAKAITRFVDNYLKDSSGDNDKNANKLPKSLTDFFIAYGMRVSGVCSEFMMRKFVPMANEKLIESLGEVSLEELKRSILDDNPVSLVLSPLVKTGEIILPSDLMLTAPEISTKMGWYLSDRVALDSLKELCSKLLRPLYEPNLLPLAHLQQAGFINRDHYYRSFFRKHGRFWSIAVFLCETVKLIEVDETVLDESTKREQEVLARTLQEAEQGLLYEHGRRLERTYVFIDDVHNEPPPSQEPQPHWRPQPTEPSEAERIKTERVGEHIFGRSLKGLVESFDANKNEVERMSERIRKRSLRLFIRLIKKKGVKPLFAKILKSLNPMRGRDKDLEEARAAMVQLMESPEENALVYTGGKKLQIYIPFITLYIPMLVVRLYKWEKEHGHLRAVLAEACTPGRAP